MLTFSKYEGCGNDFVVIDDRAGEFPCRDEELIQRLCHRKFGIGADGILLLQKDLRADFRMRIFNADGTEPEGCGNGLRCLVRFIADLGFPRKSYRIASGDQIVEAGFSGDQIVAEWRAPRRLTLHQPIGPWDVHSVDTGVPHAVIFVADAASVDLAKEAPFLRHHPTFAPRGTNVNFASVQPDGSIRIRTFERGVEGETLACGTGAMAVAVIAAALHPLPNPIHIHTLAGHLEIHCDPSRLKMTGPARKVFEGLWIDF